MKLFSAGGCHLRRELFDIELRQCDGQQDEIVVIPLQYPLWVIQTYNEKDVV